MFPYILFIRLYYVKQWFLSNNTGINKPILVTFSGYNNAINIRCDFQIIISVLIRNICYIVFGDDICYAIRGLFLNKYIVI